jgi:hypothetical protein
MDTVNFCYWLRGFCDGKEVLLDSELKLVKKNLSFALCEEQKDKEFAKKHIKNENKNPLEPILPPGTIFSNEDFCCIDNVKVELSYDGSVFKEKDPVVLIDNPLKPESTGG